MNGLDARIRVERAGFRLDVDLQMAPGETLALMGPSGAGKSTLLGVLAGFVALTAGSVVVEGRTLQDAAGVDVPSRDRGAILLGQQARLFPHLSARDNIAFGPRARRVPRTQARAEADAWMERIGLPGLGGRRPAELSGGQQQRVALARALATKPRMLLLDEPLSALDPETAAGIRSLLRAELTGTTTIMATHDAVDATLLADRLMVLEDGIVTAQGEPQQVLAQPATPFISAFGGRQVRVEQVETSADGIRVLLPPGTTTAPGSTVTLRF